MHRLDFQSFNRLNFQLGEKEISIYRTPVCQVTCYQHIIESYNGCISFLSLDNEQLKTSAHGGAGQKSGLGSGGSLWCVWLGDG
jgi:hypothetical protein